ncbi:class I SAM-dependent methyltransferase [Neorhizobium sp. DAR64861/K0K2]|uniref:class I SAM-dependent methyltransferase n=1 Tax=unclassified Neorhizobium TaxID=2629175 RepID=UPI003D27E830
MTGVTNGYFTEISYPDKFQLELSPVWLSATLVALGIRAPSVTRTSYCELGCGGGYNLCRLAAANPSMQFVGIDINLDHIATGRGLASEAELENITFHHYDLANLGTDFLKFDFIVAHGIYSWVEQPIRDAILGFAENHLARDGVVYLHYMSQPGAATFDTFRNIVQLTVNQNNKELPDAIGDGVALLESLRRAGAGFFVANPTASQMLTRLSSDDPAYIAHEYLNVAFEAQHVAAVIQAASRRGLTFVGSATPIENIDSLSLPGNVLGILAGIKEPCLHETVKDIARNQSLRRDLYMREFDPLDPVAHLTALQALTFRAMPGAPVRGPVTLETRIGPVEMPATVVSPILQRLTHGPAKFEDIEAVLPGVPTGLINQAMHILMGASIIHPLLPMVPADHGPSDRLNRALEMRGAAGLQVAAVSDPATGSGLPIR